MFALVFSKDRPLQLDACLRSLRMHATGAAWLPIVVLWKASSEAYRRAYSEVCAANGGVHGLNHAPAPLAFFSEGDFEADVRHILASATNNHCLLCVDDTMWVRTWFPGQVERLLCEHSDALAFSLRLGRSTTYCYPTDETQVVPHHAIIEGDVMKFDWRTQPNDFGYPCDISSSVYRVNDLVRALTGRGFKNPNELEVQLGAATPLRPPSHLLCHTLSAAFSMPLNRVQDVCRNRNGGKVEYTADALLARWNAGMRVRIEAYDGLKPRACHEEHELAFELTAVVPPGVEVKAGEMVAYRERGIVPIELIADVAAAVVAHSEPIEIPEVEHRRALAAMGIGGQDDIATNGELHVLDLLQDLAAPMVLDVGANCGDYTQHALARLPRARVHAFEPNPDAYVLLRDRFELEPRVTLHNVGLSNEKGHRSLYAPKPGSGMTSVYRRRTKHFGFEFTEQVGGEFITLDDHIFETNGSMPTIDLLKLDVEGHELAVLRGAKRILEAGKVRRIQFEFGGCNIDSRTFLQDFYYLLGPRYLFHRVTPAGLVALPNYEERNEIFVMSNYLAVLR